MMKVQKSAPYADSAEAARTVMASSPRCSAVLDEKCRRMAGVLESFDRIAVAYSGGVDSTFVAWFVRERLGKHVTAIFVDSLFISREEREGAFRIAEQLGLPIEVIRFDPLESGRLRTNPVDRCYFCKKEVFIRIHDRAGQLGCNVVIDGSHAGDSGAYRPGKKALSELGVVSPLALAGFCKDEIRQLSFESGIPNWNKPSQSCLATRVPYGTSLSPQILREIEMAEEYLHSLGFAQVRVRRQADLARIEVEQSDFPKILVPETRTAIVERLRDLGFTHIALDLAGFRSGCWDGKLISDMQSGREQEGTTQRK